MILDKHWWRTADGRLVPDGDPDARTLAYPRGHEIPDHLAQRIGLMAAVDAAEEPKAVARPADKQVTRHEDKAAEFGAQDGPQPPPRSGPGSGIDAWRRYAATVTGTAEDELADLTRDELIDLTGQRAEG